MSSLKIKTETIAAIATPPGVGALGVVRISGSDAFTVAASLFESKPSIEEAEPWRALLGKIKDISDWAVAIKYASPKSYTGENMVEIIAHGSPIVLRRIVDLACQAGARPAQGGEFTARAYRAGKMDLVQAEAVCGLIQSSSEKSLKLHARAVSGTLSRRLALARELLIEGMACLDVLIDHPDEPEITEEFSPARVQDRLSRARSELEAMASGFQSAVKIKEGSVWAIAGSPNAGKSTLFNKILQKDRAIVSSIAGTTRDTLEELMEIDGHLLRLIDTAGLRQANDAVENLGVQRARKAAENADGVIVIADGAADWAWTPAFSGVTNGKAVVVVWNKSDLSGFSRKSLPKGLNVIAEIDTSALKGQGIEEIRETLSRYLGQNGQQEAETVLEERHAALLKSAVSHIQESRAEAEKSMWDLASVCLRQAVTDVDAILGQGDIGEEVLSSIFAKFCVGK